MTGLVPVSPPISVDQLVGHQPEQLGRGGPPDATSHEQDFADAVARTAPVERMDAPAAENRNEMFGDVRQEFQDISKVLQVDPASKAPDSQPSLLDGDPASAPPAPPLAAAKPDPMHEALQNAMDQFQHSVAFSIRAEFASNASNSSTKVFNDLLKGN